MKTHDAIFASRPSIKAARILLYGSRDITFSPYGEHWRQLRKICVDHLLGPKMVPYFRRLKELEVDFIINEISSICSMSGLVNMTKILNMFTSNIFCRAVLGKTFRGGEKNNLFCELTEENVVLIAKFFVDDCFPSFGWLDKLFGYEKRARENFRRWHVFLDELIEDHIKKMKEKDRDHETQDFVGLLLALQNENSGDFTVTRELIKLLIMDMVGGGTETSFIALEWGLSELICNPKVMKKLQDEVRAEANKNSIVREEDTTKMNYLKAVTKEILRLHPPAPLLLPRESMETCQILSYKIPARARVIINAWAIGRDPQLWKEPDKFKPERFLSSNVDFRGRDFHFIPFGAGRRICPGMQTAVSTLEVTLANLVHRFDWELPEGMEIKGLDMSEAPGLTTRRKEILHLAAKPVFTM